MIYFLRILRILWWGYFLSGYVVTATAEEITANTGQTPEVPPTLTGPLGEQLNEIVLNFGSALDSIKKATNTLKESRKPESISNVIDQGQSEIRNMLGIFQEDSAFINEINLTLKQRQAKVTTYQSEDLTPEQLNTVIENEEKLIAGFKSLLSRVDKIRTDLKAVDMAFTKQRTFTSILLSQNRLQEALKEAEDAMSSAETVVSNMAKYLEETQAQATHVTVE